MGTRGSFPGSKAAGGREAAHSPPSSAEVKNEWNYISTPPIHHGVVLSERKHRDNFTFTFQLFNIKRAKLIW
jgi:hypothetical protein